MSYTTTISTEDRKVMGESDCSPRYETIIGQKYIGEIWVYSSADYDTLFVAAILEQNSKMKGPGWLEDGSVLKGDIIFDCVKPNFEEAFKVLNEKTLELMSDEFHGLDSDNMNGA